MLPDVANHQQSWMDNGSPFRQQLQNCILRCRDIPVVSRLAPTPSGHLHIGNVVNFLLTWLLVRAMGGHLHLRIDDMDTARCRPDFVESIFATLAWLELDWDAGPFSVSDFTANYSFSVQGDYYWEELRRSLAETGKLYACTCSRRQIAQASISGLYPGTCRTAHLSLQKNGRATRVHVPSSTRITIGADNIALDRTLGDFILWRRDGLPAYQFASVIDDRDMQTSLVIRGADLLTSSAAQLYLAGLIDAPVFAQAVFVHHPLLLDRHQVKLSKSSKAVPAILSGSSRQIYQLTARLLGLPAEDIVSIDDLLGVFSAAYC